MSISNGNGRLKFYNLSARWGHGMPEWPSAPGINVLTLQYHAKHGVYVTEFEGIMHRGTHMDAPLHVTENTPTPHRLSDLALLRHGRRGLDPEGQMGRSSRPRISRTRRRRSARTTS